MKNIHILPTDKPSRLVIDTIENKLYLQSILHEKTVNVLTQNIYITSDEKIKEGDWFIDDKYKQPIKYFGEGSLLISSKKIILTTDQDLIDDDVQAINDEFLEWFVKNPSCEEVEVLTDAYTMQEIFELKLQNGVFKYKIIIPQEEPKPHSFCETRKEKCTMNYCDENGCQNRVRHLVEPKQETLEEKLDKIVSKEPSKFWKESDERFRLKGTLENLKNQLKKVIKEHPICVNEDTYWRGVKIGLETAIEVVKLQEQDKNMYSEEEVLQLLLDCRGENPIDIEKWFEQFKKK